MGWKKDDGADGTKQRKFEASGDEDYKRAASAYHLGKNQRPYFE